MRSPQPAPQHVAATPPTTASSCIVTHTAAAQPPGLGKLKPRPRFDSNRLPILAGGGRQVLAARRGASAPRGGRPAVPLTAAGSGCRPPRGTRWPTIDAPWPACDRVTCRPGGGRPWSWSPPQAGHGDVRGHASGRSGRAPLLPSPPPIAARLPLRFRTEGSPCMGRLPS